MSEGDEMGTLNQLTHKWLLGLVRDKGSWHFPCDKEEPPAGGTRDNRDPCSTELLGEMAVGYFSLTSWRSKTAVLEETHCSVISVLDIWMPNRRWDSLISASQFLNLQDTISATSPCLSAKKLAERELPLLTSLPVIITSHQVFWEREGEIPYRGRRLLTISTISS